MQTTLLENILTPYTLNATLTLNNRIVMAPLTRCFAGEGLVPTAQSVAYYARRADVGLIISEATIIRADGQGYPNTPGIFTAAQIAAWREVTQQVHAQGGKFFMQLWHVGRVSHPIYLQDQLPIAPSAVLMKGRLPRSPVKGLEYGMPRALALEEIPALVSAYAQAAENAMAAGCDGVEIHAANGYLIDQFLHYHTNRRTDEYGGSPEKNARFALEVVDAVVKRIGKERVGIRLSPGVHANLESHPDDVPVFQYLLPQLQHRELVYVHTGIFDDSMTFDYLGGITATQYLREHYHGTLIACGGYTVETAATAIQQKQFDLVAIGRPLIANPDFMSQIKRGEPLKSFEETLLTTLY
jgi:2,4-dienoyl-CoA reductase-like NADH-dependent reductase (Old Yellow Enzyme family)